MNNEFSVLIGCFLKKTALRDLLPTNRNIGFEIVGNQSDRQIQEFMLRMTKISGSSLLTIINGIFKWYVLYEILVRKLLRIPFNIELGILFI